MSESRPKKRKIEFIESYWTGGELACDYQWNDNHGELVRCKDCKHYDVDNLYCDKHDFQFDSKEFTPDWFCADGERRMDDA